MSIYDVNGQKAIVAYGAIGPQGPGGTDTNALHVSQRLAEFVTTEAKQQARANLELDVIDLGEFF